MNLPDRSALELCNGQHHINAMLNLLNKASSHAQAGENGIPPTKEDYEWVVDIYATDLLTDESMAALVVNHEIIDKSNTEGYNAV